MMKFATSKGFQSGLHRHGKEAVSVSELSIDAIPEIDALWRDLYINCAEANPCYAPDYVKTVFTFTRSKRAGSVLVINYSPVKGPKELIGLLPLGIKFRVFNSLAPIYVGQHCCFNGSSLPLIRSGFEEIALFALLKWLSTNISSNGLFMFPELPMGGPVGTSLINLLKEKQIPFICNQMFERPLIDISCAKNYEDYSQLMKGRTKQTLNRKMRKISSLGEITFSSHTGLDVSQAMKEFCELEVKGWKGRAGTALLQDAKGKKLTYETLSSPSFGLTRIEALRLNGQAIAMNIYIGGGKNALLFKPTYDETYAKYSPGSLLYFESIKQLFKEEWTQRIDSAVLPSDQLGSIWRQRQVFNNLIFGFSHLTPEPLVWLAASILNLKLKAQNIFK